MRPSPRPRTDELLSIQIIARSIKCTRKKGRRGERKGKERRVCVYVNVARRPSVRKSHCLSGKLREPRNYHVISQTPRVIGEKERRGEANGKSIGRRVNFPTVLRIVLFFFFFSFQTIVSIYPVCSLDKLLSLHVE